MRQSGTGRPRTRGCVWLFVFLLLGPASWAAAQPQDPPTRRVTTIGYLYGFNWNNTEPRRDVVTIDFTESSRWGDQFAFLDVINLTTHRTGVGSVAGNGGTTMYGEWHTRVSPGRVFGNGPTRLGPIGDVLTAHEVNATSGVLIHAHGGGIAWRLPGVPVLKTNVLLRDNRDQSGVTWQFTTGWFVPFAVGRYQLVATGFADAFGSEGRLPTDVISDAQFLLDLGELVGGRRGRVFVGSELHYRRSSPRQLVAQTIAKWSF